jgi:type II secretory pathway component GspD/PulD (secretin)
LFNFKSYVILILLYVTVANDGPRRKMSLLTQGYRLFRIYILFLIVLWSFGASEIFAQTPSTAPGPSPVQTPSPVPAPAQVPAGSPVVPPTQTPPLQPQPTTQPPAGQVTAPPAQSGRAEQPIRGRSLPTGRLMPAKRGEISFNFDDADVFSVIQTIFGGVLQYNYIIDPKVKGRVNFRSVSPVAKEDVLPLMEVILRLNGIGVVEEGGLYRIIPIADLPREPAPVKIGRDPDKVTLQGLGLLQVVPMKFISSSEMVKVLTPFLSTNAVIVDVPKINYIILIDTDANVKRLLHLVEIFDSEQLKQIKPQVFVYPVQNAKAKDLASLLQQIYLGAKAPPKTSTTTSSATTKPGTPPGAPPSPPPGPQTQAGVSSASAGEALVSDVTKIFPDEITNSLVILATPEDYTLILETLKKIDQVPRQVMIEVLIAEITLTDELKFGLEWALRARGDQGFISLAGSFSPPASSTTSTTSGTATAPGFTFLGIDKTGLIQGFLQTLATQGKTNVLASPHIMAADNREAKIQIGSQVPIVTDVLSTTVTTQTVQYKDTGVILKIKPTINESGLVSMEINQEVSDFVFQAIGTNTFPVFTKREASTYMVAQDGQTVVIGGLIQNKVGKTRSGIPFLSKIPILGYLFGYTDNTFDRTEIILLLTPRVVRDQKEAENLTDIYIHRLDSSFEGQIKSKKITIPKE